nr:sensor histidine kinase [uncultured Dorea sp.]
MKVKSIRSKVLIAIIGITLLTATAMAFVFYGRSAKMIEENYVTVLSQRVRLLTDTIDDMLKEVCNIDIKASCDSELKEMLRQYLEDQDESRLSDIANRLRTFSKMNPSIASVYLVIPEKNQVVTTMDYPVYRSDIDAGKIRRFETKIQENDGPVIMDDLVHEESKLLAFAEVVKDTDGTVLGYVCTNIGEQNLRYDYMEDPANQELDQIKLIGDGKVIATREVSRIGRSFSEKKYKKWIRHSETAGADEKNIYIYCEGSFSRCGIFAGVKKRAVLSDLMQMRKYIFGIAAGFGIIALMAAVYISRIVYKPVQKLMTAMKAVSDGEMDTRAEIVSKDEIGLAAEEFNRMLDRIEDLIRQLIQEEKKKKDAELEALQYQITPHFMYNTLNSIKCYALIHDQKEIATVIEDFVELLQTCIRKKGTFLTVAEEVQVLENYIHLQEFRNGENYQVEYKIEWEAQQCKIPRLILQPLVENAIIHGLDLKNDQKRLTIEAYTSGSRLYLKITDNGRGMTEEQIEELLKKKGKKTKGLTAVGIPNIQDRLNLYYGRQAKLTLKSEGEGTTATIYLPVNRGEDEE